MPVRAVPLIHISIAHHFSPSSRPQKARHASVDRDLHTLDLGRYRTSLGSWEEENEQVAAQSSLKTFGGPPLEIDCQEESRILSIHQKGILAKSLPKRLQMGRWSLLYSSDRNGLSLNTLYRFFFFRQAHSDE